MGDGRKTGDLNRKGCLEKSPVTCDVVAELPMFM
jgi:hypothetical protein